MIPKKPSANKVNPKLTPTQGKSKPLKELKLSSNAKAPPPRRTLSINQTSIDTFKHFAIPTAVTCSHKEGNLHNPYFQLFQKCQRTISTTEHKLARLKDLDTQTVREKKRHHKSKDITTSPDSGIKERKLRKKPRTSRSVDNVKRLGKRNLDGKSVEHSHSNSAKKYQNQENFLDKLTKTEHNDRHCRKSSNYSDLSLLGKPFDQQTFTKKSRNKSPKVQQDTEKKCLQRRRSKSSKNIIVKSTKRLLLTKTKCKQEQKCHNQLDKIRALKEIVEIQKNLRVCLQRSAQGDLMDQDSLVTVKDFCEGQTDSGRILHLIEQIGDDVEDLDIQSRLKKLSSMAQRYFQGKTNNQLTLPIKRTDGVEHQFCFYNQKQASPQQQSSTDNRQVGPSQNQVQPERINCEQQTEQPTLTSRAVGNDKVGVECLISPRACAVQIDRILSQKSAVTHTKYQKKMELLYKLYQQQLYSPRTFQTKLQLIDSIQVKEYEEFNRQIESANKIKNLIKSMKEDKEEIAQMEAVYKQQNWLQAANIIRTDEDATAIKACVFSAQQFRIAINSHEERLPSSPVNCNQSSRINDIFAKFQQCNGDVIKQLVFGSEEKMAVDKYQLEKSKQSRPDVCLSQISVVREYCVSVFQYILGSAALREQFIRNLLTPVEYEFQKLLVLYRCGPDRQPPTGEYHYWKVETAVTSVVSQSTIKIILEDVGASSAYDNQYQKQCYQLIHQRAILDALNQSLDVQRPNFKRAQSEPWVCSNQNGKDTTKILEAALDNEQSSLAQVQNVFIRAVQRVISWAKHYCGILLEWMPDGEPKVREGIPEDQVDCEEKVLRQVRMALMLHGCLMEYDSEVRDISKSLTEVKLILSQLVTDWLIGQATQGLFGTGPFPL